MEENELNQEFINASTPNEAIENNDLEQEFGEEIEEDIDFDIDLTPDDEIASFQENEEQSNEFNLEGNQQQKIQPHQYQEEQDIDDFNGNFDSIDSSIFEQITIPEQELSNNQETNESPIEENTPNIHQDDFLQQTHITEEFSMQIPEQETAPLDNSFEDSHREPVFEDFKESLSQNEQEFEKKDDFFSTNDNVSVEQSPAQDIYTSDLGSRLVAALENKDKDIVEEPKEQEQKSSESKNISSYNISMPTNSNEKESFYEKAFMDIGEKHPSENIRKLIHLINTLPSDVSKKTGAIIIKHTMEAMGISIKELIAEAREVKDEINLNIRNSMNEIAEARKHISDLEYDINRSKNLSMQLDDLIGLFIVVD